MKAKPDRSGSGDIAMLLQIIDQGYDTKSWHGPSLKGSLRGLDVATVTWRPAPGRHCIAEIAVHCAYWKYAVRRRLLSEKRGAFALKGSNWFRLPGPLDEATWREYLAMLEQAHRRMRDTIAELAPSRLGEVPAGSRVTNLALIQGIAAHDLYHAGQVQLLKKLAR